MRFFFKYDEIHVYRRMFCEQSRLGSDVTTTANINSQCLFPTHGRVRKYVVAQSGGGYKDYLIWHASE